MRIALASSILVVVVGCAQMKRDWEAQQRANAAANAAAQPANMETLCKATVNAYCTRCGVTDQAACGQTYIECLGKHSPADPSAFTMGGVDQCSAEVSNGDCNVMPRVWPASCSVQTPVCNGGSVWDGTQCSCPSGTAWDGGQCAAVQQQY
jgi:hypothetical protein